MVWVVGQGVSRGVNRHRSGRRRAGMAVERRARLKPLHRTKHGDGGAIDGIYQDLSRDNGGGGRGGGPVGEAGRMAGRTGLLTIGVAPDARG